MNIRFLTILTTLAFLGFSVTAFAKGGKPPKDDPPVVPAVVYTVELTKGVYTFPAHKVTMNSREYLKSLDTESLMFERPTTNEYGEEDAWDAVINNCAGPLAVDFTDENGGPMPMVVNFDDWAVGRNGDDGILWINFKNIRLPGSLVPEKEIQIHLRLTDSPEITAAYPPTAADPDQTFALDSYVIWGKPLGGKGKKGWDTCYHPDLESVVTFLPAELVIKYIGVPE